MKTDPRNCAFSGYGPDPVLASDRPATGLCKPLPDLKRADSGLVSGRPRPQVVGDDAHRASRERVVAAIFRAKKPDPKDFEAMKTDYMNWARKLLPEKDGWSDFPHREQVVDDLLEWLVKVRVKKAEDWAMKTAADLDAIARHHFVKYTVPDYLRHFSPREEAKLLELRVPPPKVEDEENEGRFFNPGADDEPTRYEPVAIEREEAEDFLPIAAGYARRDAAFLLAIEKVLALIPVPVGPKRALELIGLILEDAGKLDRRARQRAEAIRYYSLNERLPASALLLRFKATDRELARDLAGAKARPSLEGEASAILNRALDRIGRE
jgi:hypothetical protein